MVDRIFQVALVGFLLFIGSCSTRYKANTSLLRPWGKDSSRLEPYRYPFVAKYQQKNKTLFYVASYHGVGEQSDTFRTIKWAFNKLNPQLVIVEGAPRTLPNIYGKLAKKAQKCSQEHFKNCGETSYAIWLALKHSTHYDFAEPSDEAIAKGLLEKGYSKHDVLFFYLLRQIPQAKRENQINTTNFSAWAEDFLVRYQPVFQIQKKVKLQDFYDWYQKRLRRPFHFSAIDSELTAPITGENALYSQKLSHQVAMIRDEAIVSEISYALSKYDRVLVVYGGSHYTVQQKVLEDMLGTAQFEKVN